MKTEFDAARLLVYRAAYLKNTTSNRVSQEVAIGKLFSTEAAQRIIDKAVRYSAVRESELVVLSSAYTERCALFESTKERVRFSVWSSRQDFGPSINELVLGGEMLVQ